jgi:hypothetical protein
LSFFFFFFFFFCHWDTLSYQKITIKLHFHSVQHCTYVIIQLIKNVLILNNINKKKNVYTIPEVKLEQSKFNKFISLEFCIDNIGYYNM